MFNIVVPDVFITNRCNFKCKYCFESEKDKKDLDIETFKKYCSEKRFLGFFTFGGEPLMRADILEEIIENTAEDRQKDLKRIITNGSLIEKNFEFIKKHGITCQISIDGPEYINNINRIYHDGKGTYDTIIHNIEICEKNNITWSVHGVVNKNTLPYLAEIYEWFYDMRVRCSKDIKQSIESMKNNLFQIIFEENYTDADVDIFLDQLDKMCEIFIKKQNGKEILNNIFNHRGGVCGVGNGLLAVDTNLDIYPCHRLASVPDKEQYKLGNICELEKFSNFEFFNSFIKIKRYGITYSANFINRAYKDKENTRLINWCPATNYQTSKSLYYINPKYIVLHKEINRKINELIIKYGIPKQ